jgi:bile acid:Na+ symporter, BASS family
MIGLLATISKRGTSVLALGVLLGLLMPPLASAARPFMSVAVFVFVLGTLLRVDAESFLAKLRRPIVSIALPLLIMAATPFTIGAALSALRIHNPLALAILLAASAPPSSGNAAVARMMGLDGATPLAATLISMALTPITVPLVASVFGAAPVNSLGLALRLAVLVGSAEGAALLIRRFAAVDLGRHGQAVDGVIVVALLVFALATMAGVRTRLLAQPMLALDCVVFAFACNILLQLLGFLFFPGRFSDRVAAGLTVGNRNVGLIWAALGSATPPVVALYFACAQFPVYILPRLIHLFVRRTGRSPDCEGAAAASMAPRRES